MFEEESKLILPPAPESLLGRAVLCWYEPVIIDTYEALPPSPYPAYLDRRVYQGSSGRVYPMPFYERISDEKHPQEWDAIHLENEYVRLMIIPSLGGRIHHATDKTTGYDFFYKNNVMKPALVGVLGPWISGGVEFNWPQHHRPATYLPTDWEIEERADGSVTVWCSDHDPFARMKGMHGITLRPGSAVIELAAKLTNRTDDVQTFLWWSNVAAEVHDDYQAFFPTDMTVVADHAKRAITSYPQATVPYYGIDYASRVNDEHPDADRIDWYRNIPVPTSYMCLGTEDNFFGGYDHREHAGFVYWADRNVAPGKKMWTWGNADFGHAWDRNLTDTEGPYIELMAGAYTDNQPDFSFLLPGETKTFSQYWYPIQEIGVVHQANLDVAIHLDWAKESHVAVELGVAATREIADAEVCLRMGETTLWQQQIVLQPGRPLVHQVEVPAETKLSDLELIVKEAGKELLAWQPRNLDEDKELPPLAQPAPMPGEIETIEELYLAGLHLEQYRHPTRNPEIYFEEALKRDPYDVRSAVALAARLWRRGENEEAEELLTRALQRVTFRNPNPYDSEIYYRLGLVCRDLGDEEKALEAFRKAAWDYRWKVASYIQSARIELKRKNDRAALEDAEQALASDEHNQQAAAIRAIALRRLGTQNFLDADWRSDLERFREEDLLNWWVSDLLGHDLQTDAQTIVDVALEYLSCGEFQEAERLLHAAIRREQEHLVIGEPTVTALAWYYLALAETEKSGKKTEYYLRQAQSADQKWAFPARLSDANVLKWAITQDPKDPIALRMLGHWLYGHDRHLAAWEHWMKAVELQDDDPVTRRNLGVAAVNLHRDWEAACQHYQRALELAPRDPKLWYERDQLASLVGEAVEQRLSRLAKVEDLIEERDDLTVSFVELQTMSGQPDNALSILKSRLFHPWEGGEGKVLRAWENANLAIAREALSNPLDQDRVEQAIEAMFAALNPPENLGEARHPLANTAELHTVLGDLFSVNGNIVSAQEHWKAAVEQEGDFIDMAVSSYSLKTLFQVEALLRLGEDQEAHALLESILQFSDELAQTPGSIAYFATSLPSLLLFHTDLDQDNRIEAAKLAAYAHHLLGQDAKAKGSMDFLRKTCPSDPEVHMLKGVVKSVS